ncbi:MAG: alpha/beta fold hydrolase [Pseudomonadota bacterium]
MSQSLFFPALFLNTPTFLTFPTFLLFALFLLIFPPQAAAQAARPIADECVVLLHGLARSSSSMNVMEHELVAAGFAVANVDYPSRKKPIQALAIIAIETGLEQCGDQPAKVHFVTHSLGGILVRYYATERSIQKLGRVVMIGPPNQGSQVVDDYKNIPGYRLINGPAGFQLGTDENSIPLSLGAVEFDLGIIAGTRSLNPILSQSLPNPDDGKVSAERTKVEGMNDFIAVPHTHTFMMRADIVIEQTIRFLRSGSFQHSPD